MRKYFAIILLGMMCLCACAPGKDGGTAGAPVESAAPSGGGTATVEPTAAPVETYEELQGNLEFSEISFTGVKGDVITTQERGYYEGDRYILFADEGIKLAADLPDVLTRVYDCIEDVTGVEYENDGEYADYFYPGYFREVFGEGRKGVFNPAKTKIEIYIAKNEDAMSYPGVIYLPEIEVDRSLEDFPIAIIHENVHELQYKTVGESDFTTMEGFATYITSLVLPKVEAASVFDSEMNYSAKLAGITKENARKRYTEFSEDFWNDGYIYGYWLVRYICENYDAQFPAHYFERMSEITEEYWQNSYREKSARIIEELTVDTIFEDFGEYMGSLQ